MYKLLICILIVMAGVGNIAAADAFFTTLDIEFPSMRQVEWRLETDTILYTRYAYLYDIMFYLNNRGEVDSLTYQSDHPSTYIDKIKRSLHGIKFYPAKYKNKPISFRLPAKLYFEQAAGNFATRLELPYDEYQCITSRDLIERALVLNDFILPGVESFPSYLARISKKERIEDFVELLYKIQIDSTGELIDYQLLGGSGQNFQAVVETPLLYAKFRPASYKGHNFNSEFYLVIRFFGQVQTPTIEWLTDSSKSYLFPFERIRMESFVHFDSLINRPIPINIPNWRYTAKSPIRINGKFNFMVSIDSSGQIKKYQSDQPVPNLFKKDIEQILKDKLKFIPARDWRGHRRPFYGSLIIEFTNSKTIRIYPQWLPQP